MRETEPSRKDGEPEPLRPPAPLAAEAYYRSVRTLAIANVVIVVLAMATIIILISNHNASTERASNKAQENLIASNTGNVKALLDAMGTVTNKANESLIAELQKDRDLRGQQLEANVVEKAQRAAIDAVADQRLNFLPKTLNADERKKITSVVASARAKTKDKQVKSDLAGFVQNFVNNGDRKAVYKEARRLLTNADEPMKTLINDKVVPTILAAD